MSITVNQYMKGICACMFLVWLTILALIHQNARNALQMTADNAFRVYQQNPIVMKENRYIATIQPNNINQRGDSNEMSKFDIQATDMQLNLVSSVDETEPIWQRRVKQGIKLNCSLGQCYLAAMIKVRIYSTDKSHWTVRELHQWLHYMLLAGVQHFFLCDRFNSSSEVLRPHLEPYIRAGLMTYYDDWPTWKVKKTITAHFRCFGNVIDTYKHNVKWLVGVDMDEYPFSPVDTSEDFFIRYLQQVDASNANIKNKTEKEIGQISMDNYLMLGKGDTSKDMVIERITQMTATSINKMVKPFIRPVAVHQADVHFYNSMHKGFKRVYALPSEMRMAHYWGGRMNVTHDMVEMKTLANVWGPKVRQSLLAFGQIDAFSSESGP